MMANEKRLIDANDLWKKTFVCDEVAEVRKFIENALTVDAVAVIRCEHCACNDRTDNDKRHGIVWCKKICRYMKADGFCSEGERRTDG